MRATDRLCPRRREVDNGHGASVAQRADEARIA
jgi:hypothetical protein